MGFVGQGPGDGYPLLLAAGKQGGEIVSPVGDFHVVQEFHDPVFVSVAEKVIHTSPVPVHLVNPYRAE